MNADQIRQVAMLEAEVKHLRGDLEDMAGKLEKTNARLDLLFDLLNQGKGVKLFVAIILSLFGVGGVLSLVQAAQPFLKGH